MKIPYGISDYKSLIEEDYYYVDKTMYLEKLENTGKTLLYLRPRRFGKTLFTSMMYYYYDINSSDKFDTLFKNTYVYNNPTPNKNNYYVLKFDFSGMEINSNDEDVIRQTFNKKIVNGILEFLVHYKLDYKVEDTKLPTEQLSNFINYFNSIRNNKKIYIIIDEYDNFTNSILSNNVEMFRKILGSEGFVKSFYARIKEYCGLGIVDRVFITGVCSISLDSMTSGFNIATNITTDSWFNSMTALTHDEVKLLLKDIPNNEKYFKEMLENYDGYKFTMEDAELVFNPTLTMYYMNSLINKGKGPEELLDSNIITNYSQLKNIISLGDYKEILNDIFDNDEIVSSLVVNYSEKTNFNRSEIISLLFYFGYLTIKSGFGERSYKFMIPNKIIKEVYADYYLSLLEEYNLTPYEEEEFNSIEEIRNTGSIKRFLEYVSNLLKKTDNRIYINFKEKDLQILMYTILIRYLHVEVFLEYPTNDKYVDMYIKTPKYNILVELKYLKKKDESRLDEVKKNAIKQIKEYNLEKNNIKKYAVVFVASDYIFEEVEL